MTTNNVENTVQLLFSLRTIIFNLVNRELNGNPVFFFAQRTQCIHRLLLKLTGVRALPPRLLRHLPGPSSVQPAVHWRHRRGERVEKPSTWAGSYRGWRIPGGLEPDPNGPKPGGVMSARSLFTALVSAKWVAKSLKAARPLKLLDASWYPPNLRRDPRQESEDCPIPGAAFFDIDVCSDPTSLYEHMLPNAAEFADYVGKLGVGNGTHVVVYDASDVGLFSSPRLWWMFRVFGHKTVSLLDGGLRTWKREGYPLSSGRAHPIRVEFQATLNPLFVKTYEDIKENIESRQFQVVDARVEGRFRGIEPEPREGIEPGHIPGTLNIPFIDFLTEEGLEKNPDAIQRLFQEKKVDLSKPLVATCGTSVTACHGALGAYLCGKPDVALYGGAWVEWYMRALPKDVISEGRGKTL